MLDSERERERERGMGESKDKKKLKFKGHRENHPSIFLTAYPIQCHRGVGVYPSCHWPKGTVHPALLQGQHREADGLSFILSVTQVAQ